MLKLIHAAMIVDIILLILVIIVDWNNRYLAIEMLALGLAQVGLFVTAMKVIERTKNDEES